MPRPHFPPPPPSTSSSLCPLVPGVPRPLSFQQTLPIKFKTEAFGERIWHFLSRPPLICLYSPPHLPGEQISLAVRKGVGERWLLHIRPCLLPPPAPRPGRPPPAAGPSVDKALGQTLRQAVLRSFGASWVRCGFDNPKPVLDPLVCSLPDQQGVSVSSEGQGLMPPSVPSAGVGRES